MPDLIHSLQGLDLGHLQIIARLWGLELRATDFDSAVKELASTLADDRLAAEVIESMGAEARTALSALARARGRIPWANFARQFGEVREMGAGKRDREQPYLKPASISEALFYRGLVGRAFFDTETGPQEFAHVPDEWLPVVERAVTGGTRSAGQPLGRQAVPAETAHVMAANDHILDEATTWLAAARLGRARQPDPVLEGVLQAAGVLRGKAQRAETVREFLESSRRASLGLMVEGWKASEDFNELRLMPGVICEGAWANGPLRVRQFVLGLLEAVPAHTWWSLNAFIADIKSNFPDFQRPAGDYDSWFIKATDDGHYLRGFVDWDRVDGALIRFLMTDIMHRLGMLDLASPAEGKEATGFRRIDAQGAQAGFPEAEGDSLHLGSHGMIAASRLVPRAVRYQLARFCEWDDERSEQYRYHVTPGSLAKAGEQGLKVDHLLALLAGHSDAGIPPALVKALKRWAANGTEAHAETQVVLRVSKPEILTALRRSRAAKYLGETLGPTTVVVKRGAMQKVAEAMTELGLLVEDRTNM